MRNIKSGSVKALKDSGNSGESADNSEPSESNNKADLTCTHCHKGDVMVDTGVCTTPHKGANPQNLSYQTYCSCCGAIGSVKLTKAQLTRVIHDAEDYPKRKSNLGGVVATDKGGA